MTNDWIMKNSYSVPPSASRLTHSLRDVGYDFQSAIADLVDNSITAGARTVEITISFAGTDSYVSIADDGRGMTANQLHEALRFGSRQVYEQGDLGRYGLGLKTASLSQARAVSVMSRADNAKTTTIRSLDLDLISQWDEWLIVDPGPTETAARSRALVEAGFRTVVTWDRLDRVLPERNPEGGWAKRRIDGLTDKTEAHLSMVFHRFLADTKRLVIRVNGKALEPWDPFGRAEKRTKELTPMSFEVESPNGSLGEVRLERFILPARGQFSSPQAFDALSGPLKWNRQQGLYFYRADRLVQWGGWAGARAIDEHTKLARAALSFDTDLDDLFNTNVAKMRVSLPANIRQRVAPSISELCQQAGLAYRRANRNHALRDVSLTGPGADGEALFALRVAALASGDAQALERVLTQLRKDNPEMAERLGA